MVSKTDFYCGFIFLLVHLVGGFFDTATLRTNKLNSKPLKEVRPTVS